MLGVSLLDFRHERINSILMLAPQHGSVQWPLVFNRPHKHLRIAEDAIFLSIMDIDMVVGRRMTPHATFLHHLLALPAIIWTQQSEAADPYEQSAALGAACEG